MLALASVVALLLALTLVVTRRAPAPPAAEARSAIGPAPGLGRTPVTPEADPALERAPLSAPYPAEAEAAVPAAGTLVVGITCTGASSGIEGRVELTQLGLPFRSLPLVDGRARFTGLPRGRFARRVVPVAGQQLEIRL